jgi:hypothetical protein
LEEEGVREIVRVALMDATDEGLTERVRDIVALADAEALRVAEELREAPREAPALFVLVGVGGMSEATALFVLVGVGPMPADTEAEAETDGDELALALADALHESMQGTGEGLGIGAGPTVADPDGLAVADGLAEEDLVNLALADVGKRASTHVA